MTDKQTPEEWLKSKSCIMLGGMVVDLSDALEALRQKDKAYKKSESILSNALKSIDKRREVGVKAIKDIQDSKITYTGGLAISLKTKPRRKKPLINKADRLFSELIRERDGVCQKCGKSGVLHCHHIISRKAKSVRWDEDNAVALCPGCHRNWAHADPLSVAEFMRERLGQERYWDLIRRANTLIPLTVSHYLEVIERLKNKRSLDETS